MVYTRRGRTNGRPRGRPVRRVRGPGGRKRYYRNRRRVNTGSMINYPVPQSRTCKLKYVELFSVNPVGPAVGVYNFRANSLFDPNESGGGHQPYGFDQMMEQYNHYQVIGSKITFKINCPTNTAPFVFGIHLDDDGTLINNTSVSALLEQPRLKRKIICNPAATDSKNLQIVCPFSAKKFFQVSAFKGNKDYMGGSASNPAELAHYICWVGAMDGTTDTGAFTCTAEIEYIAIFSEPKDLNYS